MNKTDLVEKLIPEIESQTSIRILSKEESPTSLALHFSNDAPFYADVSDSCIEIIYGNDSDSFFAPTYRSEHAYISSVVSFLKRLSENELLYEYIYYKETLLRYKIWSVGKMNDKHLIKRVSVSQKWFFKRKALRKVSKCVTLIQRD